MVDLPKESLLGNAVLAVDAKTCCIHINSWIKEGTCCKWLACINPHSHVESVSDADFRAALDEADYLVPDGAGFVLASSILGGRIRKRVTGSDIFFGVLKELNKTGGSVFFLGSTGDTLERIKMRLSVDFPRVIVAGLYSPPFAAQFSDEETRAMVSAINASRPDVLWVGMTAPKQEKWISCNKAALDVKFSAAIGAVFDFYSGNVKRSSEIWQKIGLEWLPRLIQEPRRLWRRNFVSSPLFIFYLFHEWLKKVLV